jgi:hypothetical protein
VTVTDDPSRVALAVGVAVDAGVAVGVGVLVGVRLGVEVGLTLAVGVTLGVCVALGEGVGVIVGETLAVAVAVVLGIGPGVSAGVALSVGALLAASGRLPGSEGVGVVMMTPAAEKLAIWPTGDVGVTTDAGAGVDTTPVGAAEGVDVALAIETDAAASRVLDFVGADPGTSTATDGRVGRVTTMMTAGSMTSTVERALRASVGVASRRFTTCIRNVPPHPAASKLTNSMSKIQRALRFISTSPANPARIRL